MSKITRRSYKRKKIIMGASLFGAVGLVSTGFAAWVLSASATETKQASMSVGVVSDKNMEFQNVIIYKTGDDNKVADNTFHFEPLASDNQGRVRYDGENAESLSLTVEGELTHAQNLGDMTAIITVEAEGFASAISKNYVVAPEAYKTNAVTLWDDGADVSEKFDGTLSGETDKTLSFTYVVDFAWGSFFGGVNPGIYFDGAGAEVPQGSAGDAADAGTVAGYLEDLHTLLDTVTLSLTLTANPS